MARGWESKSVEAQQEAATESRQAPPVRSEQDVEKRTRRDTLKLARTRALSDLQRACAPAHRAMLEQAVAEIDRQLALLDDNRTA